MVVVLLLLDTDRGVTLLLPGLRTPPAAAPPPPAAAAAPAALPRPKNAVGNPACRYKASRPGGKRPAAAAAAAAAGLDKLL